MTERRLSRGFLVGHWTDAPAATGCTVILPPGPAVGSAHVRGASPSTRELEHLSPDTKLTEVHAVVLTGGSAYGLASADGVMAWLEEKGSGHATWAGPVPIVPAAVIFDLAEGRSDVRPGPEEGRAACLAAAETSPHGRVGAGAGATVGKWGGREYGAPGGLGLGRAFEGDLEVAALAVVNSVGDVMAADGTVLRGTSNPNPTMRMPAPPAITNTVLAVVTTNAALGKRACHWIASRATDGITIAVHPAHTRYDGDVVFALSAPAPGTTAQEIEDNDVDVLGVLATDAVAAAVRDAVTGV